MIQELLKLSSVLKDRLVAFFVARVCCGSQGKIHKPRRGAVQVGGQLHAQQAPEGHGNGPHKLYRSNIAILVLKVSTRACAEAGAIAH
mmetsp:Transcript_27331/g.58869  ORF Transcript_27331/g.58869 Transcript_27331/m.58869 type:complete len:88 (+) Transcript_27331:557-820(+)